ncbi:MAG: carboxypeptidase-like regulatory domain-containing protein [Planctomycetota bacterium]
MSRAPARVGAILAVVVLIALLATLLLRDGDDGHDRLARSTPTRDAEDPFDSVQLAAPEAFVRGEARDTLPLETTPDADPGAAIGEGRPVLARILQGGEPVADAEVVLVEGGSGREFEARTDEEGALLLPAGAPRESWFTVFVTKDGAVPSDLDTPPVALGRDRTIELVPLHAAAARFVRSDGRTGTRYPKLQPTVSSWSQESLRLEKGTLLRGVFPLLDPRDGRDSSRKRLVAMAGVDVGALGEDVALWLFQPWHGAREEHVRGRLSNYAFETGHVNVDLVVVPVREFGITDIAVEVLDVGEGVVRVLVRGEAVAGSLARCEDEYLEAERLDANGAVIGGFQTCFEHEDGDVPEVRVPEGRYRFALHVGDAVVPMIGDSVEVAPGRTIDVELDASSFGSVRLAPLRARDADHDSTWVEMHPTDREDESYDRTRTVILDREPVVDFLPVGTYLVRGDEVEQWFVPPSALPVERALEEQIRWNGLEGFVDELATIVRAERLGTPNRGVELAPGWSPLLLAERFEATVVAGEVVELEAYELPPLVEVR